jgi:CO/xanthine dehydrogenase Mo-binding subunit
MKKRGIGIAVDCYPTGASKGGDLSQAMVRIKSDGSVTLYFGSPDLGQGSQTVMAQVAAEELGIKYDQVKVYNRDSDNTPYSFGTGASRVTFYDSNAVAQAAREARAILFEVAAPDLKASPEELVAADGAIFVRDDPKRSIPIARVAHKANHVMRKQVVGRGSYMRAFSEPDPETGACDPYATLAWGAMLAEVEVDTETGEVDVLRLVCVYDVGKAINPFLVEGQIEGGAVMGMGAALMENLYPYYPSLDWVPRTLGEYVIPTAMDIPDIEEEILECPSTENVYGVKGVGEMTSNPPGPAIVNAIHDAIGIWFCELPVTPEKVLKALEENALSEPK